MLSSARGSTPTHRGLKFKILCNLTEQICKNVYYYFSENDLKVNKFRFGNSHFFITLHYFIIFVELGDGVDDVLV